jgi:hypothetical protein
LLLTCLLAALIALLGSRTDWFGFHSGATAQAQFTAGGLLGQGCPGSEAPAVTNVRASQPSKLRAELAPIMPAHVGSIYEAGSIATSNLWTDDEPPSAPAHAGTTAAAYELRWWALDRDGGESDVGADVLEFSSTSQARHTLALASDTRCRRDAATRAAPFPTGGRELVWLNPDRAWERDVMFVRGRRLYRIADVPPNLLGSERMPGRPERLQAGTTADALACALPQAGCPRSAVPLARTGLAVLNGAADARTTPTRSAAIAYAHAVNIRGYDVPGTSEVAPEAASASPRHWATFARCADKGYGIRAVASIRSPFFQFSNREEYELVYSAVAVLRGRARANAYLAAIAGARAHACIAEDYRRLLARFLEQPGRHLGQFTFQQLPTPTPHSYRGDGPYSASAFRMSARLVGSDRRGKRYALPVYVSSFMFAHGRAIVELASITAGRPLQAASQHFLEGELVGCAQADESLL